MVVLALNVLWINLLSTGEGISAPSVGPAFVSGIEGGVDVFAGGRLRYRGKEGIIGQLDRTLRLLTFDEIQRLESWVGQTVLMRDFRGQHWWGVFSRVTRTAIKGTDKFDAAVTLELVTQDEGI